MNRRSIIASAVVAGAGTQASVHASPRPDRPVRAVVARDGARLRHHEFGAGPQTLVFTASWALDGRMWDYQVARFASLGYRCITWDRRGHGQSDVTAAGWDMDALADDLASVLDHLDLREVGLVGHSMGGAEIVRYLARHGGTRVRKVALIAPVGPFALQTADNPDGVPLSVFEGLWARYASDFPLWAYENQPAFFTPETSRPLAEQLTRQLLETSPAVAIAAQKALVMADLRSDLSKVDRPVLILHGDRDVSAPLAATGARYAAGIPRAQLKVYSGAPHGIWITHLQQVNRDLESFFRT